MARPLARLVVAALLFSPLAATVALPAQAQQAPQREPNGQMTNVLPDPPDGWKADEVRLAGGVIAMYSGVSAERTYSKGDMRVVVSATRSNTLNKAIAGSIANTGTLPPGARVEVVAGRRAVVAEAKTPRRLTVQIPAGTTGLLMLVTDSATLQDLAALAKEANFTLLTDR